MTLHLLILGETDTFDDDRLAWSNTDGWVHPDTADTFTPGTLANARLLDGYHALILPAQTAGWPDDNTIWIRVGELAPGDEIVTRGLEDLGHPHAGTTTVRRIEHRDTPTALRPAVRSFTVEVATDHGTILAPDELAVRAHPRTLGTHDIPPSRRKAAARALQTLNAAWSRQQAVNVVDGHANLVAADIARDVDIVLAAYAAGDADAFAVATLARALVPAGYHAWADASGTTGTDQGAIFDVDSAGLRLLRDDDVIITAEHGRFDRIYLEEGGSRWWAETGLPPTCPDPLRVATTLTRSMTGDGTFDTDH